MNSAEFTNARKSKNHTQASLSKAIGLSIRQISRIETGVAPVSRVVEIALNSLEKRS
jgi:transcriptional regulator with XRE-family HTH domain